MPREKKFKDSFKKLTEGMHAFAETVIEKQDSSKQKLKGLDSYSTELSGHFAKLKNLSDKIDVVSDKDLVEGLFDSYSILKNENLTDFFKDKDDKKTKKEIIKLFHQLENIQKTLAEDNPVDDLFAKYAKVYIEAHKNTEIMPNRPFDTKGGNFENLALDDPFLKLAIFVERRNTAEKFAEIVKYLEKKKELSESDRNYVLKEYKHLVSEMSKQLKDVPGCDKVKASAFMGNFLLKALNIYSDEYSLNKQGEVFKFLFKAQSQKNLEPLLTDFPEAAIKETSKDTRSSKEASSSSAITSSASEASKPGSALEGSKPGLFSKYKPTTGATKSLTINIGRKLKDDDKGKDKDTDKTNESDSSTTPRHQ